jgi:hypothetical protein
MTTNVDGFDQSAENKILTLFKREELESAEKELGLSMGNEEFRHELARVVFFHIQSLKRGRGSARPAHLSKQLTRIRDCQCAFERNN